MKLHKTYFNWSSGKDSAFALFLMLKNPDYDIQLLVTTINSHYNRVSMHGLRREVLEAQAKSLQLQLHTIELPEMPSMEDYERIMTAEMIHLSNKKYTHCGFGDIFLEDLRTYRDNNLKHYGIKAIYPLWKKDTKQLITQFLELGFKTVVVCAKAEYFSEDFVGQTMTQDLINQLPEHVDPCGENGEFHTFCFDGPIFKKPINFELGEKTYREYETPNNNETKTGFWFCDILLN